MEPDVEKANTSFPDPPVKHVYGTFETKMEEKTPMKPEQRGDIMNIVWAFGVSLLAVGTIAVYAFIIVSAVL